MRHRAVLGTVGHDGIIIITRVSRWALMAVRIWSLKRRVEALQTEMIKGMEAQRTQLN